MEAIIDQARQVISQEQTMATEIQQGKTIYAIRGLDSHFRNEVP